MCVGEGKGRRGREGERRGREGRGGAAAVVVVRTDDLTHDPQSTSTCEKYTFLLPLLRLQRLLGLRREEPLVVSQQRGRTQRQGRPCAETTCGGGGGGGGRENLPKLNLSLPFSFFAFLFFFSVFCVFNVVKKSLHFFFLLMLFFFDVFQFY